ncbi:hypothetical protein OHA25_08110 [Nonomuraea sp. NBC_00507]|uniref:hypothetical protein n=1 Tax=Nonomuraea sp. NBC_00507 TaxID=2976002 RepID=UPI002E1944CF
MGGHSPRHRRQRAPPPQQPGTPVRGVHQLHNLDGWLIAEWPRDGGGLQLQQPDGNLFVYALCDLDPKWIAAAQHYNWVLVLHGPRLGVRESPDRH